VAARRKRRETRQPAGEVSARPFWSGTITFGLVSIPVDLYPANRGGGVAMRMLGPEGKPLQREYVAENGRRALEDDEIVRGYEYSKGKYVVVTDEELERLAPDRSRDIALQRFVPVDELDPLYFERAYFLAPAGQSTKAYRLLAEAMDDAGRAGIATFVMRGKEVLVAILSENGILRAETLRFADELRSPASIGLAKKPKVSAARVRAFEQIVTRSGKRQLPAKLLEDEYAKKVRELAKRKLARGKDVVEIEAESEDTGDGQVVDLMSVLQKSLGARGARGGRKKRAA
jgi:DNA end-binding protein Ku